MVKQSRTLRARLPLILLAGGLLTTVQHVYRAEKRQQLAWLRSTGNVVNTANGNIEYAVRGKGIPVLYVHGGMGAFEQGLALADILALEGIQLITFSRPGYRRTDLEVGGTLPEQAETVCAVLDHLGIEKTFVLALSAGGMAGLQFAQNHPERCDGLILLSAHAPELAKSQPSKFWLWMLDLMLASDLFVWVLMRIGMTVLARLMHAGDLQDNLRHINTFAAGVFPASDWRIGTSNDVKQLLEQQTLSLESIGVPTLILHGSEDVIVPPVVAEDAAARIPQARLVIIEGGSHLMMATHTSKISQLIQQFIK